MASLLYRWFGIGKFPAEVQPLVEDPATFLARDGIRVTYRTAHLRLRGRRTSKSISAHLGGVIIAPSRLVLTVGRGIAISGPYDATSVDAPMSFAVEPAGLHITVDVAAADPSNAGSIDIQVRVPMTDQERAGMPVTKQYMQLTPDEAYQLSRWS